MTDLATANRLGALYMTGAMAGFAVEDVFLKAAGQTLPVGQVLILFGALGLAAFAWLTWRAGERLLPPALWTRPLIVRAGFEVTGRLFYTLAFVLTPLSSASAILQAAPLLVVAGAAVVFGERVSLRRWLAIALGLVGVLMILQVWSAEFSALSILAVLGTIGFAGRDLATRAAPRVMSWRQLGVAGFAMLIPAGLVPVLLWGGSRWPTVTEFGFVGGGVVFGVAAYAALTQAMRTGSVGAVTPFRYTRLLFALVLGMTIFGERPGTFTLIGGVLVVGAGILALAQGPRAARPQG